MNDAKFLTVAKKAAIEAGNLIRQVRGSDQVVNEKKGPFDIVTQVDLDSEKKILGIIQSSFPTHNILSEEEGLTDQGSDYTWIIDPLDGTISFVSGLPAFSVAISLMYKNSPYLGVVFKVATGQLLWAQKGQGAFLDGKPLKVRETKTLQAAFLGFDFQNFPDVRLKELEIYSLFLNKVRYPYALGGAVSSSALVAEGKLDGYIHVCRIWDFVSSAVLVEEAGGQVTNWQGGSIDWNKKWIEAIFSNGIIHDQIVEVLKGLET